MGNTEELITTTAAAELLGCSVATVNRKARTGELPPAIEGPGQRGARLYERSTVEALATR